MEVSSGKASASDSRFVASFLDGRRRFLVFWFAFSIRAFRIDRLMMRLSFLEWNSRRGFSALGFGAVGA
jgi:hypothetical protein